MSQEHRPDPCPRLGCKYVFVAGCRAGIGKKIGQARVEQGATDASSIPDTDRASRYANGLRSGDMKNRCTVFADRGSSMRDAP
jgi:hypothetical protein